MLIDLRLRYFGVFLIFSFANLRQNSFKLEWIEDSKFKDWLAMESKDTAKCTLCQKTFKIDNTGASNVMNHNQGKIHKSRKDTVSSHSTLTFKPKTAVIKSERSISVSVNFKVPLESTHAEIS